MRAARSYSPRWHARRAKVKSEGKEVGPPSESAQSLARKRCTNDPDPSAGVSFNYETWALRTFDGTVLTGILVSQTDDAVELKTAESIVHKLSKDDIDQMKKSPLSIMPADIPKLLKAQDLVDIVEYLITLRKDPG
jgi:putative heme-binding domain-containing protein